jgi:hypothetical protein
MTGTQTAQERQSPEVRNALASQWMKRGIALLNESTRTSLAHSVVSFERAIALRRSLPLQENGWYRYVLAAGWMNRGDALTRLGSAENLAEAVRSYDQALALLRTLDLQSNALFRKRLALASMNRGITLQEQGTSESLRAALASFDQAIALLRDPLALEVPEHNSILACALTNRSNALLQTAPLLARASAEEALTLIFAEEHEMLAAETGLKARYILCRAISSQLSDNNGTSPEDLVAAATDALDDALRLARLWEARGEHRFRNLARELFQFGARVYQMHQPQFLTEFLLENLDPREAPDAFPIDPELHEAAAGAIDRALAELQRDGFRSLHTPLFDRFLKSLGQLRLTRIRLDELRFTAAS